MQWFPSKVDRWLAVILIAAPCTSLFGIFAEGVFDSAKGVILLLSGPLVLGLIYGLLIFPMRYGIGATELVIRHGVLRQRADLAKIVSVKPTRNPLSSPALSLDRLEIRAGSRWRDTILISPADREGFLALLAERAGLVREGDRLTRP